MNLAEGTTTMNGVDVQINSAGGESNNVILDQVLRSSGLSQCGISTSYLIELLPSVLNSLRQEGFLSDTAGDGKTFDKTILHVHWDIVCVQLNG